MDDFPHPHGNVPSGEPAQQSARTITTLVYALQAVSLLFGFTFIVALIINYVKLSEVRGTWLESHFRWQIRTFWFSLLWSLLGAASIWLLVGYLVLAANLVWVIYRIVKGWRQLNDGKLMYAED